MDEHQPRLVIPHADTAKSIGDAAAHKMRLRGYRRAIAINAVVMAREHADRATEPFSQSDADVVMYITELLDKVAGVQ